MGKARGTHGRGEKRAEDSSEVIGLDEKDNIKMYDRMWTEFHLVQHTDQWRDPVNW